MRNVSTVFGQKTAAKIFAAALLVCLGLSKAFAAVELRFLPVEGGIGEDATYPVRFVTGALPGGSALQFDVEWNPIMVQSIEPSLSSQANSHLIEYEALEENQMRVLIYSMTNATLDVEGLLNLQGAFSMDLTTDNQPFTVSNVLLSTAASQSVDIVGLPLVYETPSLIAGAFAPSKKSVSIDWLPSNGAVGYDIYRSTSDDFATSSLHGMADDASYLDDLVGSSVTYYYWITARYDDGESSLSPAVQVVPVPSLPGQFIVTGATHPQDTALSWTILDSPQSVEVYRSIGSVIEGAEKIADLGGDSSAFTDSTSVSGIPYNYWLKITNQFGSVVTDSKSGLASIADQFENTNLRSDKSENSVSLLWNSKQGGNYVVVYSNDMKTWSIVPSSVPGTGAEIEWDKIEESDIELPAFFQVFSVAEE